MKTAEDIYGRPKKKLRGWKWLEGHEEEVVDLKGNLSQILSHRNKITKQI